MAAAAALEAGARLVAIPASLMGFSEAVDVGNLALERDAGLLVLDPFASGALDGSFLKGSPLDRPTPTRPPTVSELNERLGPVTRLGFLTRARRRTLVQTAARMALGLPAAVSVACEVRSPETIQELSHLESVPELSNEDWAALARLSRTSP